MLVIHNFTYFVILLANCNYQLRSIYIHFVIIESYNECDITLIVIFHSEVLFILYFKILRHIGQLMTYISLYICIATEMLQNLFMTLYLVSFKLRT